MAQKQWIPLEANPAVINDYISALGFPIELYHFVDVLSCDDWALDMIEKPVLGFLLLFNLVRLEQLKFNTLEGKSITAVLRQNKL